MPFRMLLGIVTFMTVVILHANAYKGVRTTDGLVMEYEFGGQRLSENDRKCQDFPDHVSPVYSNGYDFGDMILNTDRRAGRCRTEYTRERKSIVLLNEGEGNQRWRMRSERNVSDMFAAFDSNTGYTFEAWIGLSPVENSFTSIASILKNTIDAPFQFDEFITDPPFSADTTEEMLNADVYTYCSDVSSDSTFHAYDPGVFRLTSSDISLLADEKTSADSGASVSCVAMSGIVFGEVVGSFNEAFPNATQPRILQHIVVTLDVAGDDHQMKLYTNGTKSIFDAQLVTSPAFKSIDGTGNRHTWDPDSHFELGHQFHAQPVDMEVFFFAWYDRALTFAEIETNFNAWLPNSAPHIPDSIVTVNEDECTLIEIPVHDFDTQAMEQWTDYSADPVDRLADVDDVAELRLFIRNLTKTNKGTLYSDDACTVEITETLNNNKDATGNNDDVSTMLYFQTALDKNGEALTEFTIWATDGQDTNANSQFATFVIDVVPVPDPPEVYDQDIEVYVETCTLVTLTGYDVDGNSDIASYTVNVLPNPSSGSSSLYTNNICTQSVTGEVSTSNSTGNTLSLDLWYKAENQAVAAGDSIVGSDEFTFFATDHDGEVSETATVTLSLLNPVYVEQPNSITVSEEILERVILLGADASNPSELLYAKLYKGPTTGKIYQISDDGTGLEITVPEDGSGIAVPVSNACTYDDRVLPCIDYEPGLDLFGDNVDYFSYALYTAGGLESPIGFVNVSVDNGPDAPVIVCPASKLTELKAGDTEVVDQFFVTLSDVDEPADHIRYKMVMEGQEELVKFSLPNGNDYERCTTKSDCCVIDGCELVVIDGDIFARDNPNFFTRTEFYASWRAMQDIMSEINVRAGSSAEYGDGSITITITDQNEAYFDSCTVQFTVEEPKSFELSADEGEGLLDFNDTELYIMYGSALFVVVAFCCCCCCRARKKRKAREDARNNKGGDVNMDNLDTL